MRLKKGIAAALVCGMVLTGASVGINSSMAAQRASVPVGTVFEKGASQDAVTKAYDKKITQLKKLKKYKNGIHNVRISCGEGEKIMVVTSYLPSGLEGATTEVTVYQYVNGKVRLIDTVESGGTAYPIAFTKNAIVYGSNHGSGQLIIKNGKATLKELTGAFMETGEKAELTTYSVVNGKRTKKSSKKLSQKKAKKYYYYTELDPEVIGFE